MLSQQRYQYILDIIRQRGIVKVAELTANCGVSTETIRRDLFYLEKEGFLSRVHGGAVAVNKVMGTFSTRAVERQELKREAARLAVSLLEQDDIIAMDSGTTSLEMAQLIQLGEKRLTVLTHSVPAFQILAENPNIRVFLTGGEYSPRESALCGCQAEEMIRNFHVKKAFICPSCVSLDNGFTDYLMPMIGMQKAYLSITEKAYFVADHAKVERVAFAKIRGWQPGDVLVTDAGLSESVYEKYLENGKQVFRG